jgi:hypothetical protein
MHKKFNRRKYQTETSSQSQGKRIHAESARSRSGKCNRTVYIFIRMNRRLEREKRYREFNRSMFIQVQAHLERVCKANCTLRQKNTFSANQTQRLMVEKFDLEVQLKEKENYINHMKDRVGDELLSPTTPTVRINLVVETRDSSSVVSIQSCSVCLSLGFV